MLLLIRNYQKEKGRDMAGKPKKNPPATITEPLPAVAAPAPSNKEDLTPQTMTFFNLHDTSTRSISLPWWKKADFPSWGEAFYDGGRIDKIRDGQGRTIVAEGFSSIPQNRKGLVWYDQAGFNLTCGADQKAPLRILVNPTLKFDDFGDGVDGVISPDELKKLINQTMKKANSQAEPFEKIDGALDTGKSIDVQYAGPSALQQLCSQFIGKRGNFQSAR